MKNDPIIQDLRDIRKQIEDECDKKGRSYYSHLLEVQERYKDRLVFDVPSGKNVKTGQPGKTT